MKNYLLLLLVCIPILCFSQKNEIITYFGKSTKQLGEFEFADVLQLKYESNISKKISIQVGFRYHNELEWVNGIMTSNTKIIRETYDSYKIDASIIFLPINNERFKLKTGIGIDVGESLYSFASKGRTFFEKRPEGEIFVEYWQHNIKKIPDFGVHFVLSANYYFKNNLFCSVQALHNQVFKEMEYSPENLRESPLCLSIGLGHRF